MIPLERLSAARAWQLTAIAWSPACARRNVCQEVGRSGVGGRACAFGIRAMVERLLDVRRMFVSAPGRTLAPILAGEVDEDADE